VPRLRSGDWPKSPADLPFAVRWDDLKLTARSAPTGWVLGRLATGDWLELASTLRPRRAVTERLLDPNDAAELRDLCLLVRAVYTQAAGCPWWTARRLAASAVTAWPQFDGWCASQGVDPLELPLRRVLALVRFRIMEGCKDQAEAESRKTELDVPGPEDARLDSADLRAAESAAFMAMYVAGGGETP